LTATATDRVHVVCSYHAAIGKGVDDLVREIMEAYSLDAVDYARDRFGIDLDFSPESVRLVEQIAAQLYDARPRGLSKLVRKGPTDEMVETFAKMLGAYVGEVYRRTHGGEWFDHETLRTYAVGSRENCMFPVGKAYKRLTKGEEDNLWHFYQAFVE
jgi:hypothetical protein